MSDVQAETIQETINLLQKLMLEPTRVSIWFEILRKPGITAKELMNVINIQKTAMYYHLKKLEEKNVIKGEKKKKKQDKIEKHYNIVKNFFELYEEGSKQARKNIDIDFDIFSLLIVNSLLQREINRLFREKKKFRDKNQIRTTKYPISKTGMWFCTEEKLTQIKEEYQKLFSKIIELDEQSDKDTILSATHTYFWGVTDFL